MIATRRDSDRSRRQATTDVAVATAGPSDKRDTEETVIVTPETEEEHDVCKGNGPDEEDGTKRTRRHLDHEGEGRRRFIGGRIRCQEGRVGAKKVVGAVAENPLLAATGAAVLGAAIGGTALARERRQRNQKSSSKRSSAKKSSSKKTSARKSSARKSLARASSAKKPTARKTSTRKSATKSRRASRRRRRSAAAPSDQQRCANGAALARAAPESTGRPVPMTRAPGAA